VLYYNRKVVFIINFLLRVTRVCWILIFRLAHTWVDFVDFDFWPVDFVRMLCISIFSQIHFVNCMDFVDFDL